MSATTATTATAVPPTIPRSTARIAYLRAGAALAWAVAVAIAAAGTGADLSTGLALLVAAYPVIDVVASLAEAAHRGPSPARLRINAAISALAVAGLAVAAFASDLRAVLAVFGAWAIVSGLIQLANAIERSRSGTRETPMLISGGLSALAGIPIIAASRADDPGLEPLAGYAALGAVLFAVWAYRARVA